MSEQKVNLFGSIKSTVSIPTLSPSITLAAPYTAGSGSMTLSAATDPVTGAVLPSTGTFSLTILNAQTGAVYLIFRVSSVAGAVVSGAAEGPDANAPAGAAVVGTMLTVAAMNQIAADTIAGSLSVVGQYLFDGTNYYTTFPAVIKATRPGDLTLSWLTTQGTATVSVNGGTVTLNAPATTGDALRMYGNAISSKTSLTVLAIFSSGLQNFCSSGICFYESATGKLVTFQMSFFTGAPAGPAFYVSHWTNATTFGSNVFNTSPLFPNLQNNYWLKIAINAGNLVFSFSVDGINFIQLYSESVTAWFTTAPDHWGLCANANNSGGTETVSLQSLAFNTL